MSTRILSTLRPAVLHLHRHTLVSAVPSAVDSASIGAVWPSQRQHHQQQQVRWRSNRSRRGLYDGKDIGTGNNVSFSMKATKRTFKPNVFVKRVYSETLDDMIRFHLTASTLRSIDKAGGLDNYLLDPKRNITEGEGYVVKKKILRRLKNRERYARKQAEKQGDGVKAGAAE